MSLFLALRTDRASLNQCHSVESAESVCGVRSPCEVSYHSVCTPFAYRFLCVPVSCSSGSTVCRLPPPHTFLVRTPLKAMPFQAAQMPVAAEARAAGTPDGSDAASITYTHNDFFPKHACAREGKKQCGEWGSYKCKSDGAWKITITCQ